MLRCKICALSGIDRRATHACRAGARDPYPLCVEHAISSSFKRFRVRSLAKEDQAAIVNPPLANPGRWKEQSGRNRPWPTRKTTTRHTGE